MNYNIGNILAKTIANGKKNISITPDDYVGDDGLIHCALCHGKKEKIVNLLGEDRKVYCMCQCQADALKQAERDAIKKEHLEKVNRLNKECFHYNRNREYTFESSDASFPTQEAVCKAFCDLWEQHWNDGKGLTLCGNVGNGKTFLASAICNELMQHGVSCKFTDISAIAFKLQRTFEKQDVYDHLDDYDLLVIDDLFTERDTEFINEITETVINNRYQLQKPIIVTTNINPFEMESNNTINTQRIFSRLSEMTEFIEFGGKDRRKRK